MVRTDGRLGGRSVYGHVITKFSRLARLLHFLPMVLRWRVRARELSSKAIEMKYPGDCSWSCSKHSQYVFSKILGLHALIKHCRSPWKVEIITLYKRIISVIWGNGAKYKYIELDMSSGLDQQSTSIDWLNLTSRNRTPFVVTEFVRMSYISTICHFRNETAIFFWDGWWRRAGQLLAIPHPLLWWQSQKSLRRLTQPSSSSFPKWWMHLGLFSSCSGGSRPWDKGGGVSKKVFSALRASVWSTNKGRGEPGPPGAPLLDPPLSCL